MSDIMGELIDLLRNLYLKSRVSERKTASSRLNPYWQLMCLFHYNTMIECYKLSKETLLKVLTTIIFFRTTLTLKRFLWYTVCSRGSAFHSSAHNLMPHAITFLACFIGRHFNSVFI